MRHGGRHLLLHVDGHRAGDAEALAVAAAEGVTVQGVLHYFPSKDSLMLAVLERRDEVVDALCRLLDRTPSERSEDKLVFLINVRTFALFARTQVRNGRAHVSAAERMGIDDESDQVP